MRQVAAFAALGASEREQSRGMALALERLGASVRYTEYPGVGHGAMQPALAEEELTPWLFGQVRP